MIFEAKYKCPHCNTNQSIELTLSQLQADEVDYDHCPHCRELVGFLTEEAHWDLMIQGYSKRDIEIMEEG